MRPFLKRLKHLRMYYSVQDKPLAFIRKDYSGKRFSVKLAVCVNNLFTEYLCYFIKPVSALFNRLTRYCISIKHKRAKLGEPCRNC